VSAYNWSGFYIGASAGWSWGDSTASTTSPGNNFNIPLNGGILGAQAGYNWMFAGNWVLGVEGDISWSGEKGKITHPIAGPPETVSQSLDWLGTIRGRVGYAMGAWMPYVTAGFAWGNGTRSSSLGGGSSQTLLHTGYVLGLGAEWAFAQNWTAKIEYQYVNLGAQTYSGIPANPSVGITDNIFKVGLNYKF